MTSVEIDRAACEGTGYCQKVAPAVFRVGDDGIAEVLVAEVPDDLRDEVSEAEALCPTLAIRPADGNAGDPNS